MTSIQCKESFTIYHCKERQKQQLVVVTSDLATEAEGETQKNTKEASLNECLKARK